MRGMRRCKACRAVFRLRSRASHKSETAQQLTAMCASVGWGGRVTAQFSGYETAYDTAVQPDGKVVVVGETNGRFVLARYAIDGTPDTTFGANGLVLITDIVWESVREPGYGEHMSLVLQPDGKIVIGGQLNGFNGDHAAGYFVLMRFNTDGTPDPAFGTNGRVIVDFTGAPEGRSFDVSRNLTLQPDGKILVDDRKASQLRARPSQKHVRNCGRLSAKSFNGFLTIILMTSLCPERSGHRANPVYLDLIGEKNVRFASGFTQIYLEKAKLLFHR